jgi:hypothetical protein
VLGAAVPALVAAVPALGALLAPPFVGSGSG